MAVRERERARTCPRCSAVVEGSLLEGDEGVTWLWRCACGWAGARTESGIVSRRHVGALIEQVEARTGEGRR